MQKKRQRLGGEIKKAGLDPPHRLIAHPLTPHGRGRLEGEASWLSILAAVEIGLGPVLSPPAITTINEFDASVGAFLGFRGTLFARRLSGRAAVRENPY